MKDIFWSSDKLSKEYCATVVKLGPISDVQGSDFLGYTLVEGFPIVVRKDYVKEGDVMIYCQNESAVNLGFLAANNCFDWDNRTQNRNFESEVRPLIESGQKDEARKKCGFVNKYGRIRIIRLRGQVSMGVLFSKDSLVNWNPELKDINLKNYLGKDFDMVGKELFVKAFVPIYEDKRVKREVNSKGYKYRGINRIEDRFFQLHYDTQNLQRNAHVLKPTDKVAISVKFHGTSGIYANVLTRCKKNLTSFQKHMFKWACRRHRAYNNRHNSEWWASQFLSILYDFSPKPILKYGNVFSSRTVIKNKYSESQGTHDLWEEINDVLKKFIPEGYTVYGEICGYRTGTMTMIQKGYDYGCEVGENFFMPYRISYKRNQFEKTKDLEISEVIEWTKKLIKDHPELKGRVRPMELVFSGKLSDRYPEIPQDENWSTEVVKAIEADQEFGMEGLEKLCKNSVPREGVCLRIIGDPVAECFKCKCKAFLFRESKEVDAGNVDIEMEEKYVF